MSRYFAVVLLACFITGRVNAGEPSEIHGFGFWTLVASEQQEEVETKFKVGHLWLVNKREIVSQKLEMMTIVSPLGPPKYLHNFQVNWKKPVRGIGSIIIGRFIPPFAREWPMERIDRISMISYSAIFEPLVARDTGLQVSGTIEKFDWIFALMGGYRTGGTIPISNRGEVDAYLRFTYQFPGGISFGMSERVGPVNAAAVDLLCQYHNLRFVAELIAVESVIEYYYLARYGISPQLFVVTRFEHLGEGERRLTGGFSFSSRSFFDDAELKVNYVNSNKAANQLTAQFILRW